MHFYIPQENVCLHWSTSFRSVGPVVWGCVNWEGWFHRCVCVCVCVCVCGVCVCVCARACVCVCQNETESARRMASTTSENRKRDEKKSTEQEDAHFVSRVTVILTRERERDYLLNQHMSQSTCFGTGIETVDFYGWQWVPRASTVQKGEHVKDNRAKLCVHARMRKSTNSSSAVLACKLTDSIDEINPEAVVAPNLSVVWVDLPPWECWATNLWGG